MKIVRGTAFLITLVLFGVLPSRADDAAASKLYASGSFDAAAAAYAATLAANPSDTVAELNLGAIRLYQNDFVAAEPLLRAVVAADADNARAASLLRELERRRAELARRTTVDGETATIPFVTSDPLPVVRAMVDGKEGTFLIDTGGTVDLEPDFVASLGLTMSDAGVGTFAGGKRAHVRGTTLHSITLGGATAYDVPAHVLVTHASDLFGGVHIDGIVGTTLFERYLATIDYPNERLVLRPRSALTSARFQAAAISSGATIVPFWLVGDHLVFANAQVNDAAPGLFLFDSGLAGGGLLASKELVAAAHLQLDQARAGTGVGGGGPVTSVPFVADRIAVGNAVRTNVRGIYTPEGGPEFPFAVWGGISDQFLKHFAYTVDFDAMRIVLTAASTPAAPGATSGAGVDAYLQSLVPFGFSGNAIFASGGKVLLAKGYGMADRGRDLPMRADTVISVGSITKQFTAAAILKLAEMGKLNVRDSIAAYFPNVPADKRPITLHELLTHTAGLQSDYGGDYEKIARDAFVARVMAAPLESTPGSRFEYANAGYGLLAAIVERVSGTSYERFLHDSLFVPAGMYETGYRIPQWPVSRIAIGYGREGDAWGTIEGHGWSAQGPYWNLMGNGGILSTPADMLRWSEALQRRRVLNDASIHALQTGYVDEPMGGRYGYGWDVEKTPHGTLVSHNGGNGIFAAEFLRFVDSDTVVYVATNAAAVPAASLDRGLAAAAFGEKNPPAPVQDMARVPLAPQLAGGSVTVPMLAGDTLPVVDVVVNGKGPYRFGIETGAPFVAIREQVAGDLHLHAVASGEVPLYVLDTISLPGLTFARVPAIGMPFRDPNIDGVLGLNAFDALLLTLDYPGRRVTLARGVLAPADGKTILPAERVAFGYGIALDIAGYKTDAFVDTRSQTTLSLSPAMAKRISFESPPVVTGKAAGAGFAPTEVRSARIAGDVVFGAFSVKSPIASVVQLPPYLPQEALLGNSVLAHFIVTLDERSGLIRFLMPNGETSVPKQE